MSSVRNPPALRRLAVAYALGVDPKTPALRAIVLILAGTIGDMRINRKDTSKVGANPSVLRRSLCRLGVQMMVFSLVLLDIGSLGFVLVSPVLLSPWVILNVALVVGSLAWSEEMRMQREGTIAAQRQAEQLDAERRRAEERLHEAQRQELAESLRQAELRETELRRWHEEERAQTQELTERLRQAELRESELRHEKQERETQREELAERLRQAEERQRTQAGRRGTAEREAQRARQQAQRAIPFQRDWWTILGVAPSASKHDIVRNYRRRIKQYHPDRVAGLAPDFLQLAEEQTKALNEAYANAMRCRAA
jgi:DnaJ-domain-containing protein 1